MRKMKLDLETLDVTSFGTRDHQGERGTVEGHDSIGQDTTWSKHPCRSIDAGCISDPTTCGPTYYCYTSAC